MRTSGSLGRSWWETKVAVIFEKVTVTVGQRGSITGGRGYHQGMKKVWVVAVKLS